MMRSKAPEQLLKGPRGEIESGLPGPPEEQSPKVIRTQMQPKRSGATASLRRRSTDGHKPLQDSSRKSAARTRWRE